MLKVANKKTIRKISIASLKSGKLRNLVAICAIALTALLFTTLITIAITINDGFQEANFRQAGGYAHGSFKDMTKQQYDELKEDPLIKAYGLRRFVGMPSEPPFHKSHVEVSYADPNTAKWFYLNLTEGKYPAEGTKEVATDKRVLSLLGVEPVIGTEFTMSFFVDGVETTETFVLSGLWEYDEAVSASHVLIPESRAEDIFARLGTTGKDGMTGKYNMSVMLDGTLNIKGDVEKIITNHQYQSTDPSGERYIDYGVNWGYSGAQFAAKADPITVIGMLALLLIITFTGYLIIYNVFQISVAGDIRFYGLLKTLGTTPKQLRRIIRRQALILSGFGIPIGLLLGYLLGSLLSPIVLAQLNGVAYSAPSINPLIFLISALFALITVFLSCAKPGRIAANVSPIEAIRYTDGAKVGRISKRKKKSGFSIPKMAFANLNRTKGKTVVTILSLSLAILLLNITFTFTNGFDMDKYLRDVVTDFMISGADYFQVLKHWSKEASVEEETISMLEQQEGITQSGRTYGLVTPTLQFISEERFRQTYARYVQPDQMEKFMSKSQRLPDGRISDRVNLYGMEDFILDKLRVLEGDLEKLNDPSGNYIAARFFNDDYGNVHPDSNWAKLGDKVTIRHIDESEFYNPETGEVYEGEIPENALWEERILSYHDVEYTVAALVLLPYSLCYRYSGSDEFILGADHFIKDTNSQSIMYFAFDATDEATPAIEKLLADYTQNEGANYDYESKESYRQEFEGFRSMFVLMGGVLSTVIGLVGILNFLNAVMTSIITRRKEFAMLQAIGMTGKQLKTMLIWESLTYTMGSIGICLIITLLASPLLASSIETVFWFFSYQFTILPILLCLPFMLLISILVPIFGYRGLVKQSVVDRIREAE